MRCRWFQVALAYFRANHLKLEGVLGTGTLAKAGDTVLGGVKIGIGEGHTREPFERDNYYTGTKEMFDPNQVVPYPIA